MNKAGKNILFITPTLDNTGSEILLFNFINFLAGSYHVVVITFKSGSLIGNLNKSVKVHSLDLNSSPALVHRLRRRIKLRVTLPALFKKYKDFSWYINTMVLPLPVKFAVDNQVNFTLHVHELQHMYSVLSQQELQRALNAPAHLVANSQITKQQLINAGSKLNISVINPFIDLALVSSFATKQQAGMPGEFNWVMAGSVDHNKNPLLFVKIAAAAKKQDLPYSFTWLYHSVSDAALFSEVKALIANEDCRVTFIKNNGYGDYLAQFSKAQGLLLTSTYESFSLVTLEALALGMALVVNDCGGVKEIVGPGLASVMPVPSPPERYLQEMKKELERAGALAEEKNRIASAFDKAKILPAWEKLIFP